MSNKHISNLQIHPVLANFLAGVRWADMFIGDRLLPEVDTGGEKFEFETYDNSGLEDVGDTSRDVGSETKKAGPTSQGLTEDSLTEHAIEDKLDYRQIRAAEIADQIRPMTTSNGLGRADRLRLRMQKKLARNIAVDKEKEIRDVVFTAANFDGDLQDAAMVDFSTVDLPDLFLQKHRAIEKKYGVRGDTAVFGFDAFRMALKNAIILERISGGASPGQPAWVTLKLLAEALQVNRVLVGKAVTQKLAVGGAAGAVTELWDANKVSLLYTGATGEDESGMPVFSEDPDESTPTFAKYFWMTVPETGARFDVRTWLSGNRKLEYQEVTEFFLARKVMPAGFHWEDATP